MTFIVAFVTYQYFNHLIFVSQWSTPVRGSQIAVSAGEGDAASEAGSSGSSEAPPSVASCPPAVVEMPAVNVSPGVKLVIGDDEETLKSVSR